MIRRWPQLGLPLLTKELIEQSARRRTYFVRLLYASLLFLLAYWQFSSILTNSGSNNLAMLGTGADMFARVIELQFLGISHPVHRLRRCHLLLQDQQEYRRDTDRRVRRP